MTKKFYYRKSVGDCAPLKATAGMICVPHRERTGAEVLADIVIADTPMCLACFKGRPINPGENHVGLPWFLADSLATKPRTAQPHDADVARGKMA